MVLDFIINTVLISIPEESFMVAFVLILMGKVDFLNFKKSNVIKFSIPVLLTAFTTGFLRIILKFGMEFTPFLGILLIFVPIVVLYEIKGLKKIMQCFGCTVISILITGLVQLAYVPVSMSIMRLTTEDINKVNLNVLCLALPERVIEFLIIAVLYSKKKNIMRINPFRMILNNKTMSVIFFTNLIFNLFFVYIFTYEIYEKHILSELSILMQLLAVMFVIIVPVINMSSVVGIVYVLAYREKTKRMYIVEETKTVSALISVLSRRGNYTQIQDELKDFNQQIKDIEKAKY